MIITFKLNRFEVETAILDYILKDKKIRLPSNGILFNFVNEGTGLIRFVDLTVDGSKVASSLKDENGEARQIDLS